MVPLSPRHMVRDDTESVQTMKIKTLSDEESLRMGNLVVSLLKQHQNFRKFPTKKKHIRCGWGIWHTPSWHETWVIGLEIDFCRECGLICQVVTRRFRQKNIGYIHGGFWESREIVDKIIEIAEESAQGKVHEV